MILPALDSINFVVSVEGMIDSCQYMFHEIRGGDATVVVSVDGMINSCQSMFH